MLRNYLALTDDILRWYFRNKKQKLSCFSYYNRISSSVKGSSLSVLVKRKLQRHTLLMTSQESTHPKATVGNGSHCTTELSHTAAAFFWTQDLWLGVSYKWRS